jgi:hypothetical protein
MQRTFRLFRAIAIARDRRSRFDVAGENTMPKIVIALAGLLLSATAAFSQTPSPHPTPATPYPIPRGPAVGPMPAPPSAYCRAGAAALFQGAGDAELATVQQNCQRGDIIAISTAAQGSVFQIGRLCDFSKAIVNAGGQVLCALTSTRGIR